MDASKPSCSCTCTVHSSQEKDNIINELRDKLNNNHKFLVDSLDKVRSLSIQLENEKEIVKKRTSEADKLTQKVAELAKKVCDTELERNVAKAENEFLHEKRCKLYTKIKELEDLLAKRGQTEQTIFLNQPKDTTFYNPKEGLGFPNPRNLKKVNCIQLYDIGYMGLGLTKLMSFVGASETDAEEKEKRENNPKAEISFDYTKLNDSYKTREIPLSDDYVSLFPPASESESVSVGEQKSVSEKPETENVYIPKIICKIADLHKSLETEREVFKTEKEQLLNEISLLKNAPSADTTSTSSPVSKSVFKDSSSSSSQSFSSVTHHSSRTFSNDSKFVFSHSRDEVRMPEKPKQKAKASKPHCDVNDGKSKKKRFEASTYTVCDGVCLTYPLKVYSAKHLKRLSREKIFTSRKSVPSFTSAENSHTPAITQKWVPKSESQSYSSPKASKETGLGTKIKQKFQSLFCAKRDGPTLKWVPKVS
ncbi:unnamed protein product [Cuscuta epithymum]|uniref:Uncharacterized protein n=1 Tax=Cuscuta epithymum TaxID=186058 RepID=A0AAV0END3_9ASTE|nr:unnamed protein product [Cuscuta epithymum]